MSGPLEPINQNWIISPLIHTKKHLSHASLQALMRFFFLLFPAIRVGVGGHRNTLPPSSSRLLSKHLENNKKKKVH